MGDTEETEDTRRTQPSKTTEQSSYEITDTEVAITGPAWTFTRSPAHTLYSFQFSNLMGLLSM